MPMDAELGELATAAATTVVKLLATSGWEQARSAVTALWRRRHPERAETVAAELAEGHAELVAAPHEEQVEAELVTEWHARLRRLAGRDPSGPQELRELVEALTPLLTRLAPEQSAPVTMQATSFGRSRINQAGRDLHISSGD
jgi:hypothetical protein